MTKKLILEVKEVSLELVQSQFPIVNIIAHGVVSSSGWTEPELIESDKPPVDGIYEYLFVAKRPEGPAASVITPISANRFLEPVPADFKGVRVIAQTNSIEKKLE